MPANAKPLPEVGRRYDDANGRTFTVEELHIGDLAGREIRGYVEWTPAGSPPRRDPYSCSQAGFSYFWRLHA